MRIKCPINGERDIREFYYQGAAVALDRPDPDAGPEAWDDYVHQRQNPAGWHRELWQHEPSGVWLVVERNLSTHEIRSVELASNVKEASK